MSPLSGFAAQIRCPDSLSPLAIYKRRSKSSLIVTVRRLRLPERAGSTMLMADPNDIQFACFALAPGPSPTDSIAVAPQAEPMTKHPASQSPASPAANDGLQDQASAPDGVERPSSVGSDSPRAPARSSPIFRYSIRTLIVVMFCVAGVAAWYGIRRQRIQRQLDIVEPLVKMGAETKSWEGDVVGITFRGSASKPFDPTSLEPLAELPNLKRLVLIGTKCDARTIGYLAKLEPLEVLLVMDAELPDADLSPLGELEHLSVLWLTNAELSDSSLGAIGKMHSLRILNLNDNPLSDEGLMRLAGLVDLEQLFMSNCGITDNGVNLVKQTLPNVQIKREPFAGHQP